MTRLRVRAPSPALVVSLVALIVALGGTSYAAFTLPKNSVGTKQLKNGAVTTQTLQNGAVTTAKIKNGAVTRSKMNFTGVTVPNANHANNADAIAGASLNSLTVGRGATGSCDPATTAFIDCGTVSLNLPRSGRVLVLASAGYDGANSNGYRGDCRLAVDGATVGPTIANGQAVYVPSAVGGPGFNANGQVGTALNTVTNALSAGAHSFSLQCNQAGGSIEFPETYVSAVMIGTA